MKGYFRKIPGELQELISIAGSIADLYQMPAYLVGGFVRDLIMGVENLDSDIVVEGDGIQFAEALAKKCAARLVRHRRFGTATVVINPHLKVDISTARRESYPMPASLPVVEPSDIREDLARRDFTINAMAASINKDNFGRLLDLFGGRSDIRKKNIRILHTLSFMDDPTRMLRAVRFEKRYGFKIESRTLRLLKEVSRIKMLERVHPHRVRDELILILKERDPLGPIRGIQDLMGFGFISRDLKISQKAWGLLKAVKKEIAWFKQAYPRRRRLDSWLIYFMAMLESLDAAGVKKVAQKFALSRGEAKRILTYKGIETTFVAELSAGNIKPAHVYHLLEPLSYEVIIMLRAKYRNRNILRHTDAFFGSYNGIRISISGNDLKRLGLKPGPRFEKILRKILDARLDGLVKTRDEEIALARKLAKP